MQHRDIVAHNSRLAHNDRMGMVDHDALADARGWVDIDAKDLRHAHLHEISEIAAALLP